MTQVTEAIVEATWPRLGALSPAEMAKLQRRCGKIQPELTAFVFAFTSDERPDVAGVALYVFLCVMEMFRSASPARLRTIRREEVEAAWKANRDLANRLESSATTSVPAPATVTPIEPHVLQYVVDALNEPEVEENVALSEEEFGYVFLVLKTVVDCLHRA